MLNSIVVMVPFMHAVVIVTLTALAEGQWRVSLNYRARAVTSHLINHCPLAPTRVACRPALATLRPCAV